MSQLPKIDSNTALIIINKAIMLGLVLGTILGYIIIRVFPGTCIFYSDTANKTVPMVILGSILGYIGFTIYMLYHMHTTR